FNGGWFRTNNSFLNFKKLKLINPAASSVEPVGNTLTTLVATVLLNSAAKEWLKIPPPWDEPGPPLPFPAPPLEVLPLTVLVSTVTKSKSTAMPPPSPEPPLLLSLPAPPTAKLPLTVLRSSVVSPPPLAM